jgi:hypothetical protein
LIKKFNCGICNKFSGTRKGLRDHMKKEHRILREIANTKSVVEKGARNKKQSWWLTEDFE